MQAFVICLSTGYAELADEVIAPSESIADLLRQREVHTPITVVLMGIELGLAVVDCVRGLFGGYDLWKEIKFVVSRVAVCVLLRDLIICGWRGPHEPEVSFARERGGHGGLGLQETEAFALLPDHVALDKDGKGYVRPQDIHQAAGAWLHPVSAAPPMAGFNPLHTACHDL